MKLLVTGIERPDDVKSWSGIPFHLSRALGKRFDLVFMGGMDGFHTTIHKSVARIRRRLGWPEYRIRSEPAVLREFVERLHNMIDSEAPDAILSMGCEPIALLDRNVPAFLIHDSTFRQISTIYPHFQNLCEKSRLTGEWAQAQGFQRATISLATSQWARESAANDYGVPSSKLHVLPLCANLNDPPSAAEVTRLISDRLRRGEVAFLFVGVEWQRKGGDTAIELVEALVERGINAKLHIVGCAPPGSDVARPYVVSHGFLSKSIANQAAKLRTLFEMSTFFVMPSRADCSPCVFSEASAFGLPSISRAVGGIPESVRNGVTGLLLSECLDFTALVDRVLGLLRDTDQYRQMASAARLDFETRLNWDAYVTELDEIIRANGVTAKAI